ncbi:hypothetical protein [Leptospira santarosai]|uniref:hypothetical protein n=1 Tax=Leptospira santarosai TaxID=28183 RepID=UPI0024AFBC51|nr:hypothetical protein [Leptospira santarosai]MDI7188395.1 hypothetical protein [Leptospira santarosai]MDI7220367.1 hypothetical protein [Leptospira santarosai]
MNEIESINIVFKDGTIIVVKAEAMRILDPSTVGQIKSAIETAGIEETVSGSLKAG